MPLKVVAPMEVGICCADFDKQFDFYTNMLGLEHVNTAQVDAQTAAAVGMASTGYKVARLQTSYGERLKLLQPEGEATPSERSPFILGRRGIAYLTFITDDLDALLGDLGSRGIEPMSGRTKVELRPGLHAAFLRDPEDNVVELVQFDDLASYRPDL